MWFFNLQAGVCFSKGEEKVVKSRTKMTEREEKQMNVAKYVLGLVRLTYVTDGGCLRRTSPSILEVYWKEVWKINVALRQLQVYLGNTWQSTYLAKYVGSTSLTVRTKAVLLQVCLKYTWNKYEKIILLQVCFKYTSRLLVQVCLVKYDASILQAY